MGIYEFPTWLQVTVWYLFAAGAIMLLLAMFWDRPRGRLRCPRCWYDMAGAKDLKCPACGHVAKSESALRRIHRRYGWAVLGLILLSEPAAEPGWRAYELGTYWRWMPRRALIYALPWGVTKRGYAIEFEQHVVGKLVTPGKLAWTANVRYRGRDLSSSERALLAERIVGVLLTVKDAYTKAYVLDVARQLNLDAPGLESAVMAQLSGPDLSLVCSALKLARERNYPVANVLDAVIPINNSMPSPSLQFGTDEEFLCELAKFLGQVGADDPRVVPALMQLYAYPFDTWRGYTLHDSVMLALAEIGPAAREATDLLKIAGRPSPVRIYAFWMVTGRYGSRCESLEKLASVPDRDYQEFVAQELARVEPCEKTIPLLKKLISHSLIWVRDDAACSAIRLSLASAVSDEELWRQSCKILKDDSEQNFDAFWQTCDFVVEMGLDPAPLEAMVPQFRKDSRVPRGNIDTKAQELSEYRRLQGAEPFKAW